MPVYTSILCKMTGKLLFLRWSSRNADRLYNLDLDNECVHGVTSKSTHNLVLNLKKKKKEKKNDIATFWEDHDENNVNGGM